MSTTLPTPSHGSADHQHPLDTLDDRIVSAAPDDAIRLAYVRGQLVQQDEAQIQSAFERKMEAATFGTKLALTVLTIAIGIWLILIGYVLPGFLCLGAGLSTLAPEFIKAFAKRAFGGGGS